MATDHGVDDLNLNDLTQTDKTKPQNVTIPIADWLLMKKQNEEILEAFRKSDKKRKRSKKSRDGDTVSHGGSDSETDTKCSDSVAASNSGYSDRKRQRFINEEEDKLLYDEEDGEYVENDSDEQYEENRVEDKRKKLFERCKGEHPSNTSADKPDVVTLRKQYKKAEETGPEIDTDLADLFSTMALGEMEDDLLEAKMQKYKRPKNCEYFVPKVNGEMWSCLDHSARSEDIRSQKRQEVIATAVNVIAGMAQDCMTGKLTNNDVLLEGLTDAAGLMLKVMHDIAIDRRRKIVSGSNIDRKYKKLASANIKVTQFLFGDDIKGACAEIDTSSKLGSGFTRSARGRKFFPGGKNWSGRGRSDQPWRDQNSRGRYQRSQRGARFSRGRGRRPQSQAYSQGRTD